jgi:cytochrome oxidase assembly protein ShyY1
MTVYRAFLYLLAACIEVALLSLSHWQVNRYHQRIAEHAARAAAPRAHLVGPVVSYAFLTNQPKPGADLVGGEAGGSTTVGRRLIAVIQTPQGQRIADLGWQPNPPDPTAAPDFDAFPKTNVEVTGLQMPLPTRRGWLQGPLTTTHPQLLAFLAPEALTSATVPQDYLAATSTSPTLPNILSIPPALKSPLTHASYALQWLVMAIAFPVLLFFAIRRRRSR